MTKAKKKITLKNRAATKKAADNIAAKRSAKALRARHIAVVCGEVESKRLPNGRIPRGAILKVVDDNNVWWHAVKAV